MTGDSRALAELLEESQDLHADALRPTRVALDELVETGQSRRDDDPEVNRAFHEEHTRVLTASLTGTTLLGAAGAAVLVGALASGRHRRNPIRPSSPWSTRRWRVSAPPPPPKGRSTSSDWRWSSRTSRPRPTSRTRTARRHPGDDCRPDVPGGDQHARPYSRWRFSTSPSSTTCSGCTRAPRHHRVRRWRSTRPPWLSEPCGDRYEASGAGRPSRSWQPPCCCPHAADGAGLAHPPGPHRPRREDRAPRRQRPPSPSRITCSRPWTHRWPRARRSASPTRTR